MNRVFLPFFVLGAAILAAAGCSQQPALDPAVVAQHRSRLTLAEEPDGAQTVLEVRQVMFGEEAAEEHDHAHEGEEHAHDDHEHDDHEHEEGAEHDEAAHAEDAGDDPEPGEEEHADHDHEEPAAGEAFAAEEEGHDHADHDHADDADHEHADDEHADHVHDHGEHIDHDHAHDAGDDVETAAKTPVISELDVVLVGAVGGVPNPSEQSHPEFPFAKGQAIFFLADPEAVAEMEEHEHKHAPGEECAFCAAHTGDPADMLAVVQFADEKGKPLPIDARELFDLKEKETVVVRGKAKIDPSGMLIVDATGLYVRR